MLIALLIAIKIDVLAIRLLGKLGIEHLQQGFCLVRAAPLPPVRFFTSAAKSCSR